MRRLSFALLISVTFVALICAKEREWQTATVLKLIANGTETEAVVVPLPGGGAAGESTTSSGKHVRGVYWIKTEQFTYVIPNYCKSNAVGIQWWLYLTVGGQTKVFQDSARTLRIVDDDGKERKVHVIERIANEHPKAQ
jgi:hypothetical protein